MNYEDAVGQGVPEMREGYVLAERNSASTQPPTYRISYLAVRLRARGFLAGFAASSAAVSS